MSSDISSNSDSNFSSSSSSDTRSDSNADSSSSPDTLCDSNTIAIIGGGPAGLFAAELLLKAGLCVDLYDGESGVGKKFLVAGNSGLNLTHSENLESFSKKYGKKSKFFENLLKDFSPTDLIEWCEGLGVETFKGSSGRVFPKKMNASEILILWIDRLKAYSNFNQHLNHKLIDIESGGALVFKSESGESKAKHEKVIFALGGGSWPQTGSDGSWVRIFKKLGLKISPLKPMNCGFEVNWSDFCKNKYDHIPLKNVEIHFEGESSKGDIILTPYGIESGPVYVLSALIRDEIESKGRAEVRIDLKPDLKIEEILIKFESSEKKKDSLSNYLRKVLGITSEGYTLLKEVTTPGDLQDLSQLASLLKNIHIDLMKARPIEEAISTSGGICFEQLDDQLMLSSGPGLYFTGEMLDWEAPTGGYLIQGCFSTAYRVATSIIKDLA